MTPLNPHFWRSPTRLGLLGTGQLAQMIVASAQSSGLRCVVYGPEAEGPAHVGAYESVAGGYADGRALTQFLSQVDVVLFENEFVDCALLRDLSKKFSAVRFVPDLNTMELIRDKAEQKQLFESLQIPTADFLLCGTSDSVPDWLKRVSVRFPEGAVIKWARLGYDGKGVFVWTKGEDEKALTFIRPALEKGIAVYAEQKINFKRELALIACHSVKGEAVTYPLVLSEQRDGICWTVQGPAVALGVAAELETQAKAIALKLAQALPLHGVFALEFFETQEGKLLVNELAPRVHNSGHYTQNAAVTSQFENHWRAALGLPLGSTETAPSFVMLNLLGPDQVKIPSPVPLPIPSRRGHVHWYGKSGVTPKRKVGHINGAAQKPDEHGSLLQELETMRADWESALRGK